MENGINYSEQIDNKEGYSCPSGVKIDQKEVYFGDDKSKFITVRIDKTAQVVFRHDDKLAEQGIEVEPNGLLIDQKATAMRLGRSAGLRPEEYLDGIDNGLAMMSGHFGWQSGAFMVANESLVMIKNDRSKLTGNFATLINSNGSWKVENLTLKNGQVVAGDIEGASGFNGPQIVRSGEIVDVAELLEDPRIVADTRLAFDFSSGDKVNNDFFQDVRKLTISDASLRHLARGTLAVAKISSDEREVIDRLENEEDGFSALRHVDKDMQKKNRRYLINSLPKQKIPLSGFGCDSDGSLIAVLVDGRQKDSKGVSINQLAILMKEAGIIDGVLGCGGGDVALVRKDNGVIKIINSPANVDGAGNRVTRRVPNVMMVKW